MLGSGMEGGWLSRTNPPKLPTPRCPVSPQFVPYNWTQVLCPFFGGGGEGLPTKTMLAASDAFLTVTYFPRTIKIIRCILDFVSFSLHLI